MNSALLITIITLVGGFIFWFLQRIIDKRYNRTKEAIEKNTADVENMSAVVAGFKSLNDGYKERIQELESENSDLKLIIVDLKSQLEQRSL